MEITNRIPYPQERDGSFSQHSRATTEAEIRTLAAVYAFVLARHREKLSTRNPREAGEPEEDRVA